MPSLPIVMAGVHLPSAHTTSTTTVITSVYIALTAVQTFVGPNFMDTGLFLGAAPELLPLGTLPRALDMLLVSNAAMLKS